MYKKVHAAPKSQKARVKKKICEIESAWWQRYTVVVMVSHWKKQKQ